MSVVVDFGYQHLAERLSVGLAVIFFAYLVKIFSAFTNPSKTAKVPEPPAVTATIPIPFLGHTIGLMRHGAEYFTKLSKSAPAPIMKLIMPGTSLYVVTAPEAVQAAYRDQKLSLLSLSLMFLHRVGGSTADFMNQLLGEARLSLTENYWHDMNKVVRDQLAGGEPLRQMNSRVLEGFFNVINGVKSDVVVDDFYQWVWRSLFKAKTNALYGDHNPFKNETLIDQYWAFEEDHLNLMFRPMPNIFAKAAYQGRAAVLTAFREFSKYYSTRDMNDDVSSLIRNRTIVNKKWDIDHDGVAATELSLLYGSTANAIPTFYWMLIYIFQDATLLEALRQEVRPIVSVGEDGVSTVDTTQLSTCPLLKSTYQETLRMISRHPGARIVEEDTTLSFSVNGSDKKTVYRLKKGSVVQMPAGLLHRSEQTWGDDANEFNGFRFLGGTSTDKATEKMRKNAYIPLGGGKHLCPGRHLSYTEILGSVVALITGFEITGAENALKIPNQVHQFGLGIVKPDTKDDLRIRIRPRNGWEDKTWDFNA
ncbi:cytochrome P450 [Hypoxylon trugodes]|uniref:cytochrome P450 n=1 Tax=Hypoxylon trugodes TaxID=326681 RepID=UPI00218EDD95|nr:cytochrome P450 [Hypoxylon trugodes]KAI1390765.1 cytochrome P450 [Hypoxylon trugodes]